MGWHEWAAAVTVIITAIAVVPYVRDMLRGSTRPNIVTWGLWLLIHFIFVPAQLSAGASWSIVLPLTEMCTVALVFLLAVFGYGYKKYGLLDGVCLVVALAAIALWQLTNAPIVALVLSVGADLIATVPTLAKSYKDPYSETPSAYLLVVVSSILAGASTTLYDVPNLIWPVYIGLLNATVLTLILLGRKARLKRPKRA
jgi:hypothetical protein